MSHYTDSDYRNVPPGLEPGSPPKEGAGKTPESECIEFVIKIVTAQDPDFSENQIREAIARAGFEISEFSAEEF